MTYAINTTDVIGILYPFSSHFVSHQKKECMGSIHRNIQKFLFGLVLNKQGKKRDPFCSHSALAHSGYYNRTP